MKTQHMAPILVACLITQVTGNSALLINFRSTGPNEPNSEATRADFQALDPSIPPGAEATNISAGHTGAITCQGIEGAQLTLGELKSTFNSTKGNWTENRILRSYMYQRADLKSGITLSGLDRVAPGTEMALTLYGVGDAPHQDTSFMVLHGAKPHAPLSTDYEHGTIDAASVRFLLNKDASSDEIEIQWTGSPDAATAAFNALTLVVAPGEYDTLGLIAD